LEEAKVYQKLCFGSVFDPDLLGSVGTNPGRLRKVKIKLSLELGNSSCRIRRKIPKFPIYPTIFKLLVLQALGLGPDLDKPKSLDSD
jgi:hypothetical protein